MRVVSFLALALALLHGVSYSAIPLEGWYAGLMAGPTQAFDLNFTLTNPLTFLPDSGTLVYGTGFNVGGQIGYRYDKFRSEAQLIYNQNNFNTLQMGSLSINTTTTDTGASFSGHTKFTAAMFNTYYEIYKEDVEVRFVPYLGLGIGCAQVSNLVQLYYHQRQIYEKKATGYAPMGQGIVGLSYFFTDARSLSVDYRYMSTPKNSDLDSSISIQSVNFTVNLSFD